MLSLPATSPSLSIMLNECVVGDNLQLCVERAIVQAIVLALWLCPYCVWLNTIFVTISSLAGPPRGHTPRTGHTVLLWEGNSHFRHLFVFCLPNKRRGLLKDNRGCVDLSNRKAACTHRHDCHIKANVLALHYLKGVFNLEHRTAMCMQMLDRNIPVVEWNALYQKKVNRAHK